jgi:hypothetical protein
VDDIVAGGNEGIVIDEVEQVATAPEIVASEPVVTDEAAAEETPVNEGSGTPDGDSGDAPSNPVLDEVAAPTGEEPVITADETPVVTEATIVTAEQTVEVEAIAINELDQQP